MTRPAAEIEHRAASDREQVAWVDESDRVLGALPRAELRARGLIGRGTFIFLLNGQGHLCVHQRVMSKAVYPGYFDVAAGGMVAADEPYEIAAARELEEELGIGGVTLRDHGRFFFDAPGNRLWGAIYSAVSDAPLRLQPEEVAAAWFMSIEDVLVDIEQRPYCPDSQVALMHFLASRQACLPISEAT